MSKWQLYIKESKNKKEAIATVTMVYQQKLILDIFRTWILNVQQRQVQKQHMIPAETHCYCKLKFHCFNSILKHRNRNQLIRQKVMVFTKRQEKRLKEKYLAILTKYLEDRKHKKRNVCWAVDHRSRCLEKRTLNMWKE